MNESESIGNSDTQARCAECGAPLPQGGECRDLFESLLLLEGEIPGSAGSISHFYAVSTYLLQHPDSMSLTQEALDRLRVAAADALDGRVSLDDLRRRARWVASVAERVTRRPGQAAPDWRRGGWAMTITEVLTADENTYADVVRAWAQSARETLDSDLRA